MVILGYSGHGLIVAESALLQGFPLQYYSENAEISFNPFNLDYAGLEGSDQFLSKRLNSFILGIGDNGIRLKAAQIAKGLHMEAVNVIHPEVVISGYTTIGEGNFFGKGALINAFSRIGNYCIINTGAIVEHDCVLSDGVHLAPGSVLAGNVQIGEKTFIGANSVIKQGVKVGKNVIIGAGSVILYDVADGLTMAGNPGRIL